MATVKVLVVAGGGSGGSGFGGGGGAGGYQYDASFTLALGNHAVVVGAGGSASNGSNSTFSTLTAIGGGKGGSTESAGSNGGCGGGGGHTNAASYNIWSGGTGSQGYNGGTGGDSSGGYNPYAQVGGGGGGMGGAGVNFGAGGAGVTNPLTGSGTICAGASYTDDNGTANTGNGGGKNKIGGSGFVQIAYKTDGSDGITTASTGGTKTTVGLYTVHTFTSSGFFETNAPVKSVKALVVGGGGGGALIGGGWNGGGGGGGGYQYNTAYDVTAQTYNITVGAGGAINSAGGNSTFGTLTSYGGGRGGPSQGTAGGTAGGLGGATNGGGQYNNVTGGAGGASALNNGAVGASGVGGKGGDGTICNITGSDVYYGGGGGGTGTNDNGGLGGGGAGTSGSSGVNGTANTGGGGGGSHTSGTGTTGGSGVVIISWITANFGNNTVTGTGNTITMSGANSIATFIADGTLTVKFTPVVSTQAVSTIDMTTATGNGTVSSDAGSVVTERGICWKTTTGPTISDSKAVSSGTTGVFTASMTGLTPDTTYYVRAYATNAEGTDYGEEVIFETLTVSDTDLVKDISGISGATYAVQVKTNITAGTLTVKLGTTGDSEVISTTGALTTTFQGEYGGLSGLIITQSEDFEGTLDDVFWVLVVGDETIDWDLDTLTNLYPITSSVKFRRIEDKEITRFNLYRYIDTAFKDLDAYVTITVTEEANDLSTSRSKIFVVGNTVGTASPFVKKRISILSKNQAILLQYANAKLNETFTICEYSLTGFKEPRKLYKPSSIISI